MSGPTPLQKFLLIALTVGGGALIGYLAWELPIRFGDITTERVKAIARRMIALFGDGELTRELTYVVIIGVRNIAGTAILGVLTGVALRWIRYRRAFIYAILLWPLCSYAIMVIARTRDPGYAIALYEHARGAAVLYSLFLLIVFCTYRLAILVRPRERKTLGESYV